MQPSSFKVVDASGAEDTIVVITHGASTSDLDGDITRVSMEEYRLASGGRVNKLPDGTFQVVQTKAVLKRIAKT